MPLVSKELTPIYTYCNMVVSIFFSILPMREAKGEQASETLKAFSTFGCVIGPGKTDDCSILSQVESSGAQLHVVGVRCVSARVVSCTFCDGVIF